jgi:alpha-tubulin suppressor-like RCC1 family protein
MRAVPRRTAGRGVVLPRIAVCAVCASLALPTGAGSAQGRPVREYVLTSALAHCRVGYTKRTRWIKKRNGHGRLVRVKKTVCVVRAPKVPVREYTLRNPKAHCRAGYVKKTRRVRKRNTHGKLVRVKKTVCVRSAPTAPPIPAPAIPLHAPALAAVGWGYNGKGELGPGYSSGITTTAAPVLGVAPIKEIDAAGEWGAALLTDGTIKAWGGNASGQLGDGTRELKRTPVAVKGLAGPVAQIAIGGEHIIALLSNGTVETWGNNIYGQLGNGTDGGGKEDCTVLCRSLTPIQVPGLSGVVAVFASGADDAALLSNGTVVAWGENSSGQLGDETQVEKDSPTLAHGLSDVQTVALGAEASLGGHMLALLNDGAVEAVGLNRDGQVGDGSTVNRLTPVRVGGLSGVTAVSASFTHNLALLSNGTVRAWGGNEFGELGSNTPAICGGKLNPLPCATTPIPVPLQEVSTISAGYAFSLAISNKLAYSWGHNNYGQLGDETLADRVGPGLVNGLTGVAAISAGNTHAYALLTSSTPPSGIMIIPGPRSLTVNWEAASLTSSWYVGYRPVEDPPTQFAQVKLAPAARSYTVSNLEVRPYEITVQQIKGTFGRRAVEGTPLP